MELNLQVVLLLVFGPIEGSIREIYLSSNIMISNANVIHGPPLIVPQISLGRFLFEKIKSHGTRTSLIDGITGEKVTFADILDKSIRAAKWLSGNGITSEDTIAICSGNNLHYCLPLLAATYIGATVATFNPTYNERELFHAVSICKPKIVFCTEASLSIVQNVRRQCPTIEETVLLSECSHTGCVPLSELFKQRPHDFSIVDVNPDTHVAAILFSSGTTGLSKGVMLTDKNLIVSLLYHSDQRCVGNYPEDISLGLLPFFHGFAFVCLLASFSVGYITVVLPKFEEELFLKTIEKYKVTNLGLVPPLMVFLSKHPSVEKYDLSSVKEIVCGAAPISRDTQEQVMKRIGVKSIRQGYGLTEAVQVLTVVPREGNVFGSVGKLAPGLTATVLDIETGKSLGVNQIGELCFKGPSVMKGYCNNPEATKHTIDAEGFLHTGDVGYYDDKEYFYIVDRVKELIKYKGYQVPPAELEAILLTHPAVRDAAVIGVPNEEAGELPLAFIVKQNGVSITAKEILKFVSDQVSSYKKLRGGVRFIDVIPKTASGKILRRELLKMLNSKL